MDDLGIGARVLVVLVILAGFIFLLYMFSQVGY